MAAATFRFMQETAKTAMRRVLGIRGGQGETLVPPTAVAGGDEGFVFEFEASDNNNSGYAGTQLYSAASPNQVIKI